MATGVLKWFSPEKGYSFISEDDGPDVFVYFSAIQGAGYRKEVEFELTQGQKGPQAATRSTRRVARVISGMERTRP